MKKQKHKIRLVFFLYFIFFSFFTINLVKAHEMGEFEKHEKKVLGTTINDNLNTMIHYV